MSNLFRRALNGEVLAAPPIWLMRQAGRYHRAYQELRKLHSFEALCKTPALAAEVAMGPIRDFDFDAAIVFCDLLFPLDVLGFPVRYDDGSPKIDVRLTRENAGKQRRGSNGHNGDLSADSLAFQWESVAATRAQLSPDKGLIGFVGGPWTLFVYAACGSHTGALDAATSSLDLYRDFSDRLVPVLTTLIGKQLEAGADVVMIFDTAAGALPSSTFHAHTVPDLARLASAFPKRVGYFGKGLTPAHLNASFSALPWAGFGFDPDWSLPQVLRERTTPGFVQGNFDPNLLRGSDAEFERGLEAFLTSLRSLTPEDRRGWICGLGHGVLPATPEDHVRTFIRSVRETFQ